MISQKPFLQVLAMKNVYLFMALSAIGVIPCSAGFGDADDGFLTEGEYDGTVWLENHDKLFVIGGGQIGYL